MKAESLVGLGLRVFHTSDGHGDARLKYPLHLSRQKKAPPMAPLLKSVPLECIGDILSAKERLALSEFGWTNNC